jgi:outer membrane protein assembly factor BamB
VTSRTLALLVCLGLAACGNDPDPNDLTNGAIRSVLNLPGTNALALDVAFDPSRDGILLAALQSGPADYGRGVVGRATSEPPVAVFGRYNEQLQAMWSNVNDAAFSAEGRPALAADAQGNMLLALGGFAGTLDLGDGPRTSTVVAQLSLADGFTRWSASLPANDAPRPRFILADADGSTVVGSDVDGPDGTTGARLDRLAPTNGALLTSRPLGIATGNVFLESLGLDADGNLVAGGGFDQTLTLAAVYTRIAGHHAGFVAKIGRDSGAALWSRPLRKRSATDRIIVAPLAGGDVAVAGVFAFADDAGDPDNPLEPTLYLRLARLSGATGETVWTERTNLPNTAALDVADLADGSDDLLLNATFSGTFQLGALNAVSTAETSMAMVRFGGSDGTPQWLRYSSTTTARAARIGVDASGDAVGAGTFVSQDADGKALASIFVIRVGL